MDADKLFLEVCSDLENLLEQDTNYSMVKAAALLRQLLIDAEPLVHRVNRKYRVKLVFQVGEWRPAGEEPPPDATRVLLSGVVLRDIAGIDGFLAMRIVHVGGRVAATAADVIKLLANARGGVHLGSPASSGQQALDEFGKRMQMSTPGGEVTDMAMHSLRGIATDALRGLQPLRDAVIRASAG